MNYGPPDAEDYPLIFDSWAKSFRKSPWAGCIPNSLYDSVSRTAISEILNRGARVITATIDLEAGGRRVVGYSVSEPIEKVLHWLYVKRDYRGMGWGKALLDSTCPDDGWSYTYRTKASARFLGPSFTWDPTPARVKASP